MKSLRYIRQFSTPLNHLSTITTISTSSPSLTTSISTPTSTPISTSTSNTSTFLTTTANTSTTQSTRHFSTSSSNAQQYELSNLPSPVTPAILNSVSSTLAYQALPNHMLPTTDGLFVDRTLPRPFNKVLIANRGEIAVRVIRTCRQLNIATVAIYSSADKDSLHVQLADEAYCIGNPPANESYLLGDRIIEIAKKSGAQAIHPGYGFLSENADFATTVEQNNIIFIGPPASAMQAMGNKSESKKIMIKANVPVIPGYHGEEQSVEFLKKQAEKVGFPLMIKAVLGGGGKGMRIVNSLDEFEEKLESSKRESMKSFKDDRVLLERYIQSPRHIEFQIFADSHNGAIHCFERDCSIQRRHQKVIEEAPAFYLTPELRAKMGNIAVMAAKAVNYRGAGTVEFIMDTKTNDFFFMEMNTRLQVEHPVSEMILQKDFVQLQLHVAAGGKLPYTQDELQINGHAIEARIYAENPSNNFLPQVGHLVHFHPPQLSANVRLETHLRNGEEISMFYDPMIAKLITWASTRQQAISYMYKALSEFYIVGVATNIEFVKKCLLHSAFIKGDFDTNFIGQNLAQLIPTQSNIPIELSSSVTALALLLREAETRQHSSSSPWNSIQHFSTANRTTRQIELLQVGFVNNEEVETSIKVDVTPLPSSSSHLTYQMKINNQTLNVSGSFDSNSSHIIHAFVNERSFTSTVLFSSGPSVSTSSFPPKDVTLYVNSDCVQFKLPTARFDRALGGQANVIRSPMAGKIVKVNATVGQKVTRGTPLLIMEAMKMEHVLRAPMDGIVATIVGHDGDFVEGGKVMITFEQKDEKKN